MNHREDVDNKEKKKVKQLKKNETIYIELMEQEVINVNP